MMSEEEIMSTRVFSVHTIMADLEWQNISCKTGGRLEYKDIFSS